MRRIVRESCGLSFLLILLIASVAERSSGDEPVPPDPILEEIIQLRRAIGDTRPPGQKLAPSTTDDETFVRALRRVAAQDRDETPSQPAVPAPMTAPGPQYLDDYVLYDPATEQHADLVDSLRATSRMLDAVAHDHEDKSQYDEADRLRNLARKLRNEARRHDRAAGSPPSPGPVATPTGRASGPALTYPRPTPPAPAY